MFLKSAFKGKSVFEDSEEETCLMRFKVWCSKLMISLSIHNFRKLLIKLLIGSKTGRWICPNIQVARASAQDC